MAPAFGLIGKDLGDSRDFLFDPLYHLGAAHRPALVNLTGQCPSIYDQGEYGTCVANMAAALFEFDLLRQNLPDIMPSRAYIYYWGRPKRYRNFDSGTTVRAGIRAMAKYGVCPESMWDYSAEHIAIPGQVTEEPSAQCQATGKLDRVMAYHRIPQSIEQIEACLAMGLPFGFGISVYESFVKATDGNIPMPMTTPNDRPLDEGHAMAGVGYDSAARVVFIRNSWGTEWGGCGGRLPMGYGVIPYEYFVSENASDFWVVTSVEEGASTKLPAGF